MKKKFFCLKLKPKLVFIVSFFFSRIDNLKKETRQEKIAN